MRGRAFTNSGRSRNEGWTLTSSAHSSSEMRATVSRPSRRTSHRASTLFAPGNRPAMPITAMTASLSSCADFISDGPPLAAAGFLPGLSAVGAAREPGLLSLARPNDLAQDAHRRRLEQRGDRDLHRILLLQSTHQMNG